MTTKQPQRFDPVKGLDLAEREAAGLLSRPNRGQPLKPAAMLRRMLMARPDTARMDEAARALGYTDAAAAGMAGVDTTLALILWMQQRAALLGQAWALAGILDRVLPKPKRVELTGSGPGGAIPIQPVPPGAAGTRAASDYFAELNAAPRGDAEEDEDRGFYGGEVIDVEAITDGAVRQPELDEPGASGAPDPSGEDLL